MARTQKLPTVHGATGRPPYADAVRRAIYAALELGATRTAAWRAAGISEATFYRWMTDPDDSEFRDRVEQAEGKAELRYTRRLASHSTTSPTATMFWLERRRPREWRERVQLETTPTLEDAIDEAMNDDELRERLSALAGEALRRGASRGTAGGSGGVGEAGEPE